MNGSGSQRSSSSEDAWLPGAHVQQRQGEQRQQLLLQQCCCLSQQLRRAKPVQMSVQAHGSLLLKLQ